MPRASWRGFLRLSLVTCPVYLSPATTGTKPIRLHQVWQPAPVEVNEDALPDRSAGQQGSASSAPQLAADHTNPEAAQSRAATRIALRPHDPGTGEEIDKREVSLRIYRAATPHSSRITWSTGMCRLRRSTNCWPNVRQSKASRCRECLRGLRVCLARRLHHLQSMQSARTGNRASL